MKPNLPSNEERHGRGRVALALAAAAGALLGVALIAVSAPPAPPATADDVRLDSAPIGESHPMARARRDAPLDEGVNWAAVDPSVDAAPLAVAAYER